MLFAFLISTADKEIYNIFYSPNNLIQTGQQTNKHTNTHTNKHKSSFNNKDYTLAILNRGVPVSEFVRLLGSKLILWGIENVVYLFICGTYQESKQHIEYAESEFRTFEFVICKFIVVYMNIK